MLRENDEKTRHNFTDAYKCMTYTYSILAAVLGGIFAIIWPIIAFATGMGWVAGLLPTVGALVLIPLAIFVNIHFYKVVQTYENDRNNAHTDDGYLNKLI